MKGAYILLILLLVGFGGFSQTALRLIGFASYHGDSITQRDTVIYSKYSLDRTGEIRAWTTKFSGDNILTHDFPTYHEGVTKFDSAWKMTYLDTQLTEQFFDEANNIIYAKRRLVGNNNIIRDLRTIACKYDNKNNLLEQIDTIWNWGSLYSVVINQYTYDSKNNVSSYLRFSLNKSDTTSKSGQTYFYDNDNKVIDICNQYWYKPTHSFTTGELTRFCYTGDRLDSSYIFDVGLTKYGPDTILKIYNKYSYSLLGDTTFNNYYWTYTIPYPGALYFRKTEIFDVRHNKISMTMENLDSALSLYKTDRFEYTYNSFNQATSEKYYTTSASGAFKFTWLQRYYYETYNPGPPYIKNDLEIYPSPTKSELTLKLLWQDAQPFAVCIYNSVGQRIMQWDEPAIKEYKKTISLPELASGNYFIQVNSGKQRIVKKFVIN